ncbi:VirB4 family type IV secretion/conjugal transfer ATPase [Brevundimonas nasdae]|uniref:VirB4 family type IV secretion/conjugal transfer ATPase n=1 Tax=Brevundimonas nasdae TaxID=172043 RepID=UPI003F6945D0
MQLLPPLTRDAGAFRRERPVGAHLPYAAQIDNHTVVTRDGLLLQTLQLRGLLFETSETAEINYRKRLRESMLRAVGNSRFALYHHIVRRRVDPTLSAEFPDGFSQRLNEVWCGRLAGRKLYVNDLFLTLMRRPMQGRLGWADKFGSLLSKKIEVPSVLKGEVQRLTAAREALAAGLESYGPRVLSAYGTPQGDCSEVLEFLSLLLEGETRPVLMPEVDVGHYLPTRRISFGQQTVELAGGGGREPAYVGIVAIKDYPARTAPGMLDELLRLPVEMTITQSFGFVERQDALSRMNLALRRMRSADDEAISLRDSLADAKDDAAAGRASFGEHHMTVAVRADTPAAVDEGIAEIIAGLADIGVIAVREDIAVEPTFWAQLPGNFKYIVRKGLVSTSNFASLASGHNFPTGEAEGNHWGQALTLLETTAAGPYYFNFHTRDLGNFTIIGPTGSGKTVVLNFLLAQARKYRPRLVFFDKDRGAELFIRAIGGRYDVLRPGSPSGLNPLQLDDTPANRQFLLDWVGLLVGAVTVQESLQVKDAIDACFAQPAQHRRLKNLAQLFRGAHQPHAEDLWARLSPWWGDGEHAWLFDNAEDLTDIAAETVGFDMTAILDDRTTRSPVMMYLFHRVEERLDGSAAIVVVDEGWKALDDEVFVRRIKDWEKTIRKRNGIVGFATQSAQDALESQIASAIIEQAATQIFMVNPKARVEDYVEGFGLTRHEYELIKSLPDSVHCFLIKRGGESVLARLDLTGEKDLLVILSGRERTVRLLDGIRQRVGDAPEDWMLPLLEVA